MDWVLLGFYWWVCFMFGWWFYRSRDIRARRFDYDMNYFQAFWFGVIIAPLTWPLLLFYCWGRKQEDDIKERDRVRAEMNNPLRR